MAEQGAKKKAPAGWYDDPKLVNTRRYWDGAQWTDHRQEKPPPTVVSSSAKETRTLFNWGLAMAVLLPVVGFIIGVVLLSKKSTWGIRVIIASIIFIVFYYKLATS